MSKKKVPNKSKALVGDLGILLGILSRNIYTVIHNKCPSVQMDRQTDDEWTDKWMDGSDENYLPLLHTSYAGGIIRVQGIYFNYPASYLNPY